MASLSKRGSVWYIVWRDENGIVRRQSTRRKEKSGATRALRDFEKMCQMDTKDPYAKWRRVPLDAHADDYAKYQLESGTTEKQVRLVRSRIGNLLRAARFTLVSDITISKVVTAIDGLRKHSHGPKRQRNNSQKLSNRTKCFYAKCLRQLLNWMVSDGRLANNPLPKAPNWKAQVDIRHSRCLISDDDFSKLEYAARSSTVIVEGFEGKERAMLYRIARLTGLRRSEIASLSAESFILEGRPRLIVEAAYSKHREEDTVFLHPDLVEPMRSKISRLSKNEKLFPRLAHRKTAKMMREDLAAAGIPYRDANGAFRDFHALRHSFVTMAWKTGADAPTVMAIARHKDIKTTLGYSHRDEHAEITAIQAMKAPERKTD